MKPLVVRWPVALAAGALVVLTAAAPEPKTPKAQPSTPKVETAKKGNPDELVEMEVRDVMTVHDGDTHAVILSPKGEDTIVPIFIGPSEALAISLRLRRETPPRPLTHDLLEKVIRALGAKVTKIHIDDLRDSVYLGKVFLAYGDKAVELDARPSDSIALAVGSSAPIFAARKVIDQAGLSKKDLERGGDKPNPRQLLKPPSGARDESL